MDGGWEFLGDRVVVVSTFRPNQDGIARYTEQLLAALEPTGRRFLRLGIAPGGGDRVRFFAAWLRPLVLLRDARGFDELLVMYIPTYWQAGSTASRAASLLSLRLVTRLRRVTFVIHEPDLPLPPDAGRREAVEFRVLEWVRRLLWGRASLVFHTDWERRRFRDRYPGHAERSERLVDHGATFTTTVAHSREAARVELGLPADRVTLLMIGFLSPHKRFERGIKALALAGRRDVDLHIVGSPISDWPEVDRCVAELRELTAATPGVQLHEQFVTDTEFDLWIRAADAVLVPYETASSSGVVARAQVVGTTLVSSAAGGIAEQLTEDAVRFADDDELVEIIRGLPASAPVVDGRAR